MLIEVLPDTMSLLIKPILFVLMLFGIGEYIERKCGVEGYSIVFLLGAGTMYILPSVLYFLLELV